VGVGGQCRPIRLLSGAEPLYAPIVKMPRRTAYLSPHTHLPTHPLPLPETLIADTTPLFVLQVRYGGQMGAIVIFGGHVSGKGEMPSTRYV